MFDFIKNGAFIAIIAHGLIGISLVWDKVLLKNPGTKNLFSYVFWLGSMSIFGLLLIPFGYKSPSFSLIGIAFLAGIVHLAGVFFYYVTLKRGEASETLAVMGGFSPVATAGIGFALLSKDLSGIQLIGFALMTAGGFVMFFSERVPLKKLLPSILLAAGLLGLVNVLEKIVYDQTNFVSGYVWFTIGTFVGAIALLVRSSWRKQIFSESGQDNPRNRFWYFVNRFISGVGSFLIFYAISLIHPAIVDAISGLRYGVIFLGALVLTRFRPSLLKESFRGWQLATKAAATLLVIAGLVIVGMSGSNSGGSGSPVASFVHSRPEAQRNIYPISRLPRTFSRTASTAASAACRPLLLPISPAFSLAASANCSAFSSVADLSDRLFAAAFDADAGAERRPRTIPNPGGRVYVVVESIKAKVRRFLRFVLQRRLQLLNAYWGC